MRGMHLHHGNRLEELAAAMADSLLKDPPPPLEARTIIVESGALARWLKLQLCRRHGIAMLVDTPLPAAWLWQTATRLLGLEQTEDPLSRERLRWLIYDRLDIRRWEDLPEAQSLIGYLRDDEHQLKRWQLAGRLAEAFDRYQYYRPELLRRWQNGDELDWQACLWRELIAACPTHRNALLEQFPQRLRMEQARSMLPRRLDLFSIHNLPPSLLSAYAALAEHLPVHLWLLSPTADYWADLASPKTIVRQRLEQPDDISLWQAGNPLLTQWGRQGQAFQDLLLERIGASWAGESEHFVTPDRETLLGCVQSDIFEAVDPGDGSVTELDEPDPSIQIHIAHGPMRECEVLRDVLLRQFKGDPELKPEDVLVMVPDIGRYACYIEAVFGHADPELPRLPYNISDVPTGADATIAQAFLKLLDLPDSRFTRSDVLDLLHVREVARRFSLEDQDIGWLEDWFERLRVYWGLDGEDKRERLGLPDIDQNTWHQAFARTMAGFSLGDQDLLHDIAPSSPLGAQQAECASRFFALLDHLRDYSLRLRQPRPPRAWAEELLCLLHDVFERDPEGQDGLEGICEALAELGDIGRDSHASITLPVLRDWLGARLQSPPSGGRFYSGGITFCGLQPLRGVPFRIIALLGMQDGEFPRPGTPAEFDRMRGQWRHGDPDPSLEDRYLMLETLLAARERLIICYSGRNEQDNEPLQPSIVVQELVDVLDQRYRINGCAAGQAIQQVHGLQPFSTANFDRETTAGFDAWWHKACASLYRHQPAARQSGWPAWHLPLPEEEHPDQIDPRMLNRALSHPIRHFMQQRLHLHRPADEACPEDEPFTLDALQQWQLRNRIMEQLLLHPDAPLEKQLRAAGMLPHGLPGSRELARLREDIEPLLTGLTRPLEPANVDVRISLGRLSVQGRLDGVFKGLGALHWMPTDFRVVDALPAWITHLCLHACAHELAGHAHLICRDGCRRLSPLEPTNARQELGRLAGLYLEALQRPLPLLRKSSSAYVQSLHERGDRERAMKKARAAWHAGFNSSGECEDFHVKLLLRRHQWEPDDAFAELAERVLMPLMQCLEDAHG